MESIVSIYITTPEVVHYVFQELKWRSLKESKTPDHKFNVPTGEGEKLYWVVFDLKISNNGETVKLEPVNIMIDEETPRFIINGEEWNDEYEVFPM